MAAPTRTPPIKWIEAGLRALADGGPDAVRVEPLAKALGVSRGGFYWHFQDRAALLEQMLAEWERRSVDEVIERVETEGGDPKAKALRAVALNMSADMVSVDLAIRDWARRDPAIAERLRRVDNRGMDYARSLVAAFTDDEDDIEIRCLLAFSLVVGGHFLAADHGKRSRAELIDMAMEWLLRPR